MGKWAVAFADDFLEEVAGHPKEVQDKIAALALVLEQFSPQLGRPRVDTLIGSRHANMKELRFEVDAGVWRVAFAFDPERKAILLAAGNKQGVSEARFYRELNQDCRRPIRRAPGDPQIAVKRMSNGGSTEEGAGAHVAGAASRHRG